MEQPYAGFEGDIPSFREHPRISVADTKTVGIALIAFCAASEVVADIGKVLSEKMPDEGSYINDMEMATDITTDGFMYLWEHREHLDFDVNIKGYIYNYVKTRCISHLRKRKSMLKAQSELYKKEQWRIESSINTLSNEEQIGKLFQSEIIEIYRRELAKMPSLTRNVFLASRLEDMTYHQIAEKFNLTVRQVTSEIQRANFLLRTPLKDYLVNVIIMLLYLQ